MKTGDRRSTPRSRTLAFVLAAAVGVATAAGSPGAATAARPDVAGGQQPSIVWGDCPALEAGGFRDAAQECGTLQVSLDYRNPSRRTIDLAVSRLATATPELRRGILLLNPGGPGGSGLDLPSLIRPFLPQDVLDRYDLIGFDPRGVGHSTPVTCGLDLNAVVDLILPYPLPDGDIRPNIDFGRQAADACAEHSGDVLRYITTANTARDMDAIRSALGEPKMSYFGLSYGTYLGTAYLSLFPRRADRIVLDSAIDPNRVWYAQWRTMSQGVAVRFPDFTTYAAGYNDVMGFGATADEVAEHYQSLVARLDANPIVLPEGTLTGNVLREVTRSELYDDRAFPQLAQDWMFVESIVNGDGAISGGAPSGGATAGRAASTGAGSSDASRNGGGAAARLNDSTSPEARQARDLFAKARRHALAGPDATALASMGATAPAGSAAGAADATGSTGPVRLGGAPTGTPALPVGFAGLRVGSAAAPGATGGLEGEAPVVPGDNSIAARYAVVCGDVSWSGDLDRYQHNVDVDRVAYPLTNGMPANLWPCPFWKTRPVEPPVQVTDEGERNVLILQNRRDPATPWKTGMGLRRALGDRAAFVGVDAGGHIAFGKGSCADTALQEFLVTGALPDEDMFCPAPSAAPSR